MSRETPCNKTCLIDPNTELCFGCGRTLPEIAHWSEMAASDRSAIMAALPQRMADAGLLLPSQGSPDKT